MSFDFFNSTANKKTIKHTQQQQKALRKCWKQINNLDSDKVNGKIVIAYMKQIGLKDYQIRQIWKIANANCNEYLDQQQMKIVIRLMMHAQNGQEINQQKLAFPALKRFEKEGTNLVHSQIPNKLLIPDQKTVNSFNKKWSTLQHKSSGLARGSDIKRNYQKQAAKQVLSQIWKICSRTIKGHLTKGQSLLFQHFINLSNKNVSVNSLPAQSKKFIQTIDSQNVSKILAYSTQLEIQKQNIQKYSNNTKINTTKYDKQTDSNNQVQYLKNEMQQIKRNQNISIDKALDTIRKLQNIIQSQNIQIKQLKQAFLSKGQLQNKRLLFVESCQYILLEKQYGNNSMKKKQIPLISNVRQQVQKITQHSYTEQFKFNIIKSQEYQPKDLMLLRQKTIKLLMQKTPMMPHELRLIERRINQMQFQQLQNQYNDLRNKGQTQRQTTEINMSMLSAQKIQIIKNIFQNVSVDQNQL